MITTRQIFVVYEGKQVLDIREGVLGGKLYYNIDYNDKSTERVFNPNKIVYRYD